MEEYLCEIEKCYGKEEPLKERTKIDYQDEIKDQIFDTREHRQDEIHSKN